MKVSKKAGIALFVTTAVIMAVLIVFHKNLGPAADPGQELAKKIISCVVIAAALLLFTGMINSPDCRWSCSRTGI